MRRSYCRYIKYASDESFTMTPATELHSVGFVFYELVTGDSPFGLESTPEPKDGQALEELVTRAISAITTVVPPRPSLVNPNLPGSLDTIIMRLLEKKPEDRFASAGELAKALEQALADADASWDASFEIPGAPQPSPNTRGAQKLPRPRPVAKADAAPVILPPLPGAAAAKRIEPEKLEQPFRPSGRGSGASARRCSKTERVGFTRSSGDF